MKSKIKNIITSIKPTYESSGSYKYPMPNEISLFLDNGINYVDINLKDNILQADISVKETEIELKDNDLDFLYNYLEVLLAEEIELTQRYYEEERYNEQQTYFIR
jgi:hypothetical protein